MEKDEAEFLVDKVRAPAASGCVGRVPDHHEDGKWKGQLKEEEALLGRGPLE